MTQEPPKEETPVNLNSAEKAKESKTPQSGDSQKEEMKVNVVDDTVSGIL